MTFMQILDTLRKYNVLVGHNIADIEEIVTGKVQTDNRIVSPGDIFVCIKGFAVDGHSFISDVQNKGVACVVQERTISGTKPSIQVTNSRKAAALITKMLMGNPTSKFDLIGVTGTNGKTTTSLLIFNALIGNGFSCGWIGTLGYYINDNTFETKNTTPDIVELNNIFNSMVAANVQYVVMEVSSHALALDRVYGLEFDYCLFTNLSRDHLDFHADMHEYAETKALLFDQEHSPNGKYIINTADQFGRELFERLSENRPNVFSVAEAVADFQITNQDYSVTGSVFSLVTHTNTTQIRSHLTGAFNIFNLAMAAATLSVMGFGDQLISQMIADLEPVPGRMQSVPNNRNIGIFIDYAHTPEAIENVLKACQRLPHNRILCLIGAGGNRDAGKRPLMLKAALSNSNAVVITDDNPRLEDPRQIIREIVQDTNLWLPWWIIRDREQAIASILRLAQSGDIVVICGKGHETYQEIQGVRHEFSDLSVVQSILDRSDTSSADSDELILAIDPLQLEIIFSINPDVHINNTYQSEFYTKISTDSRTIQAPAVYFAIRGESFDGNNYVPEILEDAHNLAVGDSAVIVHDRYIHTGDSIHSLGALCRKYLLMFDVYKVALTGSTGKTTTKELLYNVISELGSTLKTDKNENNVIGLCKTILRIQPVHKYAVLELGTNHFGEIAQLSDICFPDCGVVINIGPSHLEYFGDEDGVFREKSALLNRPVDLKVFTADDPRFEMYKDSGFAVGLNPKADFQVSQINSDNENTAFMVNGEAYSIPYAVPFYALNAAFAVAIGTHLGIPRRKIQMGLNKPIPMSMRMQIEHFQDTTVIVDCYNANPVSMQNAIRFWRNYEPQLPHIAILGDMLELGDTAEGYHKMIGAILSENPFKTLYTVGHFAKLYHPEYLNCQIRHFDTVSLLLESDAISQIPDQAIVLLKGSHGINLDKIVPAFKGRL